MPDPDQYAATQAASLRDDWQFSRIFSGAEQPACTALLGLRAELQQVLAQTGEPGISAMKFEWWRSEIERAFSGEAQHPLARALGTHLGKKGLAPEYCIEIVDAAEMEASGGNTFNEQDFRLYLYRSGGVLAELLQQLTGRGDRRTLDTARRLGELKRFTELVVTVGAMLHAGAWLFPRDWLTSDRQALLAGDNEQSQQLVQRLKGELDKDRIATRTAMEGVSLSPALALQWNLAQRDYRQLDKRPTQALARTPWHDNPLARLWTAWRGARHITKQINNSRPG